MYYSHPCSYCRRIFFIYHDSREHAAIILFTTIKKHLIDYNEDHKEYEFDETASIEEDQMYEAVTISSSPPSGGYEIK